MIRKPLDSIEWTDLAALIDGQVAENELIEFKESPRERGDAKQVGLSEAARNKLLREVVAFANSDGGDLIIGIAETSDQLRCAAELVPFHDAADIADRIAKQIRDCIEPTLIAVQVRAIMAPGDGGAVIVRVGPSMSAPHRLKPTKESYTRRSDRSEVMTMREVHDLVRLRDRGAADVEARLNHYAQAFKAYVDIRKPTEAGLEFGLWAVPISPLPINRLCDQTNRLAVPRNIPATISNKPHSLPNWRAEGRYMPILRGVRLLEESRTAAHVAIDVMENGTIFMRWRQGDPPGSNPLYAYSSWFLGSLAHVLILIERLRDMAHSPATRYALQVGFSSASEVPAKGYFDQDFYAVGAMPRGIFLSPTYEVGELDTFCGLATQFDRDFWNHVGSTHTNDIVIPFDKLV